MAWRGDGNLLSLYILLPLAVATGWILYAILGPDTAWLGVIYAVVGALALSLIAWGGWLSWRRHEHTDSAEELS